MLIKIHFLLENIEWRDDINSWIVTTNKAQLKRLFQTTQSLLVLETNVI